MEKLYAACSQLPPDFQQIRVLLQNGNYSPETLSKIMQEYLDEHCLQEVRWFISEKGRLPQNEEIYSGYLYELAKLLLEYGMNPNHTYNGNNVMSLLYYTDHGFVPANTLRLLLENGGNPNLDIEWETLYEYINDDTL